MGNIFNITQDLSQYIELNLVLQIILIYLTALWISLIIWVTRDAINRSNNLFFQVLVIILNIFLPVFGLVIYLIIRPTKTLLERYYEDLEYRALVDNTDEKEICSKCKLEVSKEYDFCPGCGDTLRQKCSHCQKEFSKKWKICPFCGKNVGGEVAEKQAKKESGKSKKKKSK